MVKIKRNGFTLEYSKDFAGCYTGTLTIEGCESIKIQMDNLNGFWDNDFNSFNFGMQEDAVYSFADAKECFLSYGEMFAQQHAEGNTTPLCEVQDQETKDLYESIGNKCLCPKCK
tara:strand:- start:26 stop:370 length:345 start_codon:yes stop_codon:yes gene_type:complete